MTQINGMMRCASLALIGAGLVACGASDGGGHAGSSTGGDEGLQATAVEGTHPAPVASVEVGGKTISVYEGKEGVLITELGKADGSAALLPKSPRLLELVSAGRLVDLFGVLRPDLAVPSVLVELEARHPAATADGEPGGTSTRFSPEVGDTGGGAPWRGDSWCGNVCCDYNWLTSNICVNDTWMYFEYGWSYRNSYSFGHWYGAACAITGNSQYTLSGKIDGSWTVPQGYYQWEAWNGINWGTAMYATVNSSSDQHNHSFCGNSN